MLLLNTSECEGFLFKNQMVLTSVEGMHVCGSILAELGFGQKCLCSVSIPVYVIKKRR